MVNDEDCVHCTGGGHLAHCLIVWYNVSMQMHKTHKLLLGILAGIAILGALLTIRSPQDLVGRVLERDELLRTQVESDFDRDGDIDFLDFTVFSAFYEDV